MDLNRVGKRELAAAYKDLFLELNQLSESERVDWEDDLNHRIHLRRESQRTDSFPSVDRENTIAIPLLKGWITIIDIADADLAQLNWYAKTKKERSAKPYIVTNAKNVSSALLHRVVLSRILNRNLDPYELADHINGNSLDNRRCNLRLATTSQNNANRGKHRNNRSGFKGVFRNGKKWRAVISTNGKAVHIGTFDTPEEAHEAYKIRAIQLFGEFANFG